MVHQEWITPLGTIITLAGWIIAIEGVLLLAQADDLDWFARELSRLPFAFRVLNPQTLAAAVRAHAQRLLVQHGTENAPDDAASQTSGLSSSSCSSPPLSRPQGCQPRRR